MTRHMRRRTTAILAAAAVGLGVLAAPGPGTGRAQAAVLAARPAPASPDAAPGSNLLVNGTPRPGRSPSAAGTP